MHFGRPAGTARPKHALLRSSAPKTSLTAIALAIAFSTVVAQAKELDAPLQVQTTAGDVRGFVEDGVRQFLGIPYAEAPVGELRWKPPVAAAKWEGVFDANAFGPSCVQNAATWRPGAASTNEDCLSINIYTPTEVDADTPLPISVYIHGGGDAGGSSDIHPTAYAQRDAIAVTINYRLGAMGFMSIPALDAESDEETSGNYALLDQMLALEWLKDNAVAFGGDPERIIVAGESFGGGTICSLLASPKAAGLFSGAIMQSSNNACPTRTKESVQNSVEPFFAALKCDADDPELLACLRSKSAEEIIDAQRAGGTFRPIADGVIVPKSGPEAFASGDFNKVPIINGSNLNERTDSIYRSYDLISRPMNASEFEGYVRSTFKDNADKVLDSYPLSDFATPGDAAAAVRTDYESSCPALSRSANFAKYVPTYVYEFRDVTAPLHRDEVVPSSLMIGAYHSAEVAYVWGGETLTEFTPAQLAVSDAMIRYWRHFAATGTMNAAGLPKPGEYDPASPQIVAFNVSDTTLVSDMSTIHHCDLWNEVAPGPR